MAAIYEFYKKSFSMAEYKFGEITEKIIGSSFRIHGVLGNGFQEVIYQRALELELRLIPLNIGLLINFGSKRLQFHRLTNKKFNPLVHLHSNKSNSSHSSQFRQ